MVSSEGTQAPHLDAAIDDQPAEKVPTAQSRSKRLHLLDVLGQELENFNFRLLFATLLVRLIPALCLCRLRAAIYRRVAGIPIGAHTMILGTMEFSTTAEVQKRLRIGSHTIINKRVFIDLTGDVAIGDNVSVGHHVVLITADHDIGRPERRSGALRPRKVTIEDGVWVGACTTVLPGVRVGAASVVTAGALVAADVPPNKLVGGVPARTIKQLPT
jgi:maltose O-acetyltransferase